MTHAPPRRGARRPGHRRRAGRARCGGPRSPRRSTGRSSSSTARARPAASPGTATTPGYGLRDLHRLMSGPAYARRLVRAASAAGATLRTRVHGHRVGPGRGRAGHQPSRRVRRAGQGDHPGHRRPRTAPHRQARPRRPPPGHLHHRPAAEPGPPPPRLARHQGGRRRRRAGQLVGRADPARGRLPDRGPGDQPPPPGVLRGVQPRRPGSPADPGPHRVRESSTSSASSGWRRSSSRTSAPADGDGSPATQSYSPATGSPTTSSPGWPTSTSTRAASARWSTPPFAPAALESSPRATWSIPSTRPTWPPSTGCTSPSRYAVGWRPRPVGSASVRLLAEAPFEWVAPSVVRQGDPAPARSRLLLGPRAATSGSRQVSIVQRGAEIASARVPWPAAPGRVFRLPSRVLDRVDFTAGDVTLRLG